MTRRRRNTKGAVRPPEPYRPGKAPKTVAEADKRPDGVLVALLRRTRHRRLPVLIPVAWLAHRSRHLATAAATGATIGVAVAVLAVPTHVPRPEAPKVVVHRTIPRRRSPAPTPRRTPAASTTTSGPGQQEAAQATTTPEEAPHGPSAPQVTLPALTLPGVPLPVTLPAVPSVTLPVTLPTLPVSLPVTLPTLPL